jgi:prevent-host-death family protein
MRTLDIGGQSWLDVAMTSVKIAELKDHLSEHLRAVERGAEIVVTDRDRPIAMIVPMPAVAPRAVLRPPVPGFEEARDRHRQPANWAIDSLTLLLEERGEH